MNRKFILHVIILISIYGNNHAQKLRITFFTKIGPSTPALSGYLSSNDRFGGSLSIIGDIDKNGVNELAIGASQDDDGGSNRGCIYILFRDVDLSIIGVQKISDTQGAFTGNLVSLASFGCSIRTLGDLNKDGTNDIIVGAYRDNSALQSKSGVAWIIFLNSNGSVKSHTKIGEGNSGFNEALDSEDYFGGEISVIDDYDKNGIRDLAISAHQDDDGGVSDERLKKFIPYHI